MNNKSNRHTDDRKHKMHRRYNSMDNNIIMDEKRYRAIEKLAGAEAAMLIDDAETFGKVIVDAQEVKPRKLDAYLRGAVVLAIELIDTPPTDGIIIYFKRPKGEIFMLEVDALSHSKDGSFGRLDFTGAIVEAWRKQEKVNHS